MILVTGATGNIGGALIGKLGKAGVPVRALSRSPDRAAFPAGVEAVEGDLTDPDSLRSALRGVDALFLLQPGTTDTSQILESAAEAGVHQVVTVSSLFAQTHPESFIGRNLLHSEQIVRESGLEWTILRPWEFASNTLAWAAAIRAEGVVRAPRSGVPSPAIDPDDIAAVAASALLEDGHCGAVYPLTGPAAVTPAGEDRGHRRGDRPRAEFHRGLRPCHRRDARRGRRRRLGSRGVRGGKPRRAAHGAGGDRHSGPELRALGPGSRRSLPVTVSEQPDQHRSSAISSAARHPIAMTGPLRLPETIVGRTEQSTTRRPSTPRTRNRESTTSPWFGPIAQVPTV